MSTMGEQQFWDTVFIAAIQSGKFASTAADQAGLAVTFRMRYQHMIKQRVTDNGQTLGQRIENGEKIGDPYNSGGRD